MELLIQKQSKDEAFYTVVPDGRRRCLNCIGYQRVENSNPPAGTCEFVWGIIDPEAHCDDYLTALPNRKSNGS